MGLFRQKTGKGITQWIWIRSIVALLILLGISIGTINAQDTGLVKIRQGAVLYYPDTQIVLRRDTFLQAADTIGLRIRDDFFTRIYFNFIKIGDGNDNTLYQGIRQFDDRNAPYIGATIGKIDLQKLEPFGTNLFDPDEYNDNWLVRSGNFLHIQTRDRIIRNYLSFHSGDTLAPYDLGDSERLLREQYFIKDARVQVAYRPETSDTVDLVVIEKDIWSLLITLRFPESEKADIVFEERNFLGLGLGLNQSFRIDLNDRIGYIGLFRAPNVLGSFTNAEVGYSNIPGLRFFNVDISRQFVTPEIRYGGGGNYSWTSKRDTIYPADQPIYTNDIGYNEAGVWMGYNTPINRRSQAERRSGIISSLGYQWTSYFKRPEDDAEELLYQDAQLYIGSISLSRRQYFTDNLLFGFGRTEDIPSGMLIELTGGYEVGEFVNRPYGALNVKWARNTNRSGYFSTRVSFGGFFPGDKIDQGMFALQQQYFSKLIGQDRSIQQRSLLSVNIVRGINRRSNEVRRIDNRFGVRGLNSDSLRGQSTAVFSLNHNFFTKWRPLGFRFAASAFADIGYFSRGNDPVFSGRPYWSFGPSLQFNNENFIFGSLILRFSLHPQPPDDAGVFGFSFSFSRNIRFQPLDPRPPGLLPFLSEERSR